jgi:Na+-transporting NADH:ubiquinone oxidoreductase subunit NqrE
MIYVQQATFNLGIIYPHVALNCAVFGAVTGEAFDIFGTSFTKRFDGKDGPLDG